MQSLASLGIVVTNVGINETNEALARLENRASNVQIATENLAKSTIKLEQGNKNASQTYDGMVAKLTLSRSAYDSLQMGLKGFSDEQIKHVQLLQQYSEGLKRAADVEKNLYNERYAKDKAFYEATLENAKRNAAEKLAIQNSLNKALQQSEASDRVKQNIQGNAFVSSTSPQIQALNQRMELESSIRVNGLHHIQTQEIQAAQAEIAIRKRLTDELLRLETLLRDGTISNRSQLNFQRSQALQTAEKEITANNKLIESQRALNSQLNEGVETHGRFEKSLGRVMTIMTAMVAYRAFSFLASLPAQVIATNVEFEKMQFTLTAMLGSVDAAKSKFKELLELDIKSPFDIEALTKGFNMLTSMGLQPTKIEMKSLTDYMAFVGADSNNLTGVITQLGQAWAKGKLQLQDMNIMVENHLPVISLLKEATGKTGAEILEMSKKGQLTHDIMRKLFVVMESRAPDFGAKAMNTMWGALSNLTTATQQFQAALLNDAGENKFKEFINDTSNLIFKLKDNIDLVIQTIVSGFKIAAIAVGTTFVGSLTTMATTATASFAILNLGIRSINFGVLILASYKVGEAIGEWANKFDAVRYVANEVVGEMLKKAATLKYYYDSVSLFLSAGSMKLNKGEQQDTITKNYEAELVALEKSKKEIGNSIVYKQALTETTRKYTDVVDKEEAILVKESAAHKKAATEAENHAKKLKDLLDRLHGETEEYKLSGIEKEYEKELRVNLKIAINEQEKALITLATQQKYEAKSNAEFNKLKNEEILKYKELTLSQKDYYEYKLKLNNPQFTNAQVKELSNWDSINKAQALFKSNASAIEKQSVGTGFNDLLSQNRTALNEGVINETQFKEQMRNLATAYNDEFIEPAHKSTQKMSEFAKQAARNMESSFAQFLYDPFKNGLKGMLSSFIDTIRKMAAEAAATRILDNLVGKKDSGSSGLLGTILKAVVGGVAGGIGGAASGATSGMNTSIPSNLGGAGTSGWASNMYTSHFASGGDFDGGLRIVGENGPELEATGKSRIFNAQQTKSILSGAGNSSGGTVNNVTIVIQAAKDETPEESGHKAAEAFMRSIARQEITTAARPQNQLNKTTKIGAF
jgi:tape measure domain-containing protein